VEFEPNDKLHFLDILLIKSDFHLLFSIYRKPTHSNRYLNFRSCHPILAKQGVVISLMYRAFRICFHEFLDSELLYLSDILFCCGYPIKFVDKIIKNRRIKHGNRAIGVSQSSELNMSKIFTSLPYVPILGEMLKRILCKHNIDPSFQSVRPKSSFLNFEKNLTQGDLDSGVDKIACFRGKFYIGRSDQQFLERFIEHRNSIPKILQLSKPLKTFLSALAKHTFFHPEYFV